MRGLEGKRLIVAGSATGIGAATARRLGEEGARLFLGDINIDGAQNVAKEIGDSGGTAKAQRFDLLTGFVNSIQDQDDGLIQDHRRIGE